MVIGELLFFLNMYTFHTFRSLLQNGWSRRARSIPKGTWEICTTSSSPQIATSWAITYTTNSSRSQDDVPNSNTTSGLLFSDVLGWKMSIWSNCFQATVHLWWNTGVNFISSNLRKNWTNLWGKFYSFINFKFNRLGENDISQMSIIVSGSECRFRIRLYLHSVNAF